jgi:hypothetical protein
MIWFANCIIQLNKIKKDKRCLIRACESDTVRFHFFVTSTGGGPTSAELGGGPGYSHMQ